MCVFELGEMRRECVLLCEGEYLCVRKKRESCDGMNIRVSMQITKMPLRFFL